MKRSQSLLLLVMAGALVLSARNAPVAAGSTGFQRGTPAIQSMSALSFSPDGILFLGDGKGAAVFAVDLQDTATPDDPAALDVKDVEAQVAALLGTSSADIMIHDMAVNPVSQNVYLAVSRGRSAWDSRWKLPNDLADANVLVRVSLRGEIDAVSLENVRFARVDIPNPVDDAKEHPWKKGVSLRADTITDMSYSNGTLYVAGLSNENFASTMWRIAYPFSGEMAATTLEIFHGAHGEYETHAPIRSFVPYTLNGNDHLLAAYLCTPFVTFEVSHLQDGQHIRGRTIAEFGSGNYPLDMIVYQKDGKDRLFIANSNLPFIIIDPEKVASFDGEITEKVEGYVAGMEYEPRSGTGIQQLDNLNRDFIVALQRVPWGTLDLFTMQTERF